MSPRPIHRWKSFRVGVVVFAILMGSWVRSVGHLDEMAVAVRTSKVVANWASGEIAVTHYPQRMRSGFPEIERAVVSGGFERRWVGTAFYFRTVKLPPAGARLVSLRMGHWFIILLFLMTWTAWLAWRLRREQRKQT